jgi:uncharacterized MnhB-related membrane protein
LREVRSGVAAKAEWGCELRVCESTPRSDIDLGSFAEPYVPVNSGSFVEPSFFKSGVHAYAKKVLSSVIALGVTGAFMALEFILLHAPDVAIAEAAVGAVLATTIFIIAVKKTTSKEDEEK